LSTGEAFASGASWLECYGIFLTPQGKLRYPGRFWKSVEDPATMIMFIARRYDPPTPYHANIIAAFVRNRLEKSRSLGLADDSLQAIIARALALRPDAKSFYSAAARIALRASDRQKLHLMTCIILMQRGSHRAGEDMEAETSCTIADWTRFLKQIDTGGIG
jgi:hypothetical protein